MQHRLLMIIVAMLTAVAAPAVSAQTNIALINRETKAQLVKAKVLPRDIYDQIQQRVTTLPPPSK